MQKRKWILIAVLLMLSIMNYLRINGQSSIRNIEFVSIFVVGALSALLISEVVKMFAVKK